MPPLRLDSHPSNPVVHGFVVVVEDRAHLIELVARLVLGQHLHVERVLGGHAGGAPVPTMAMIERAAAQLQPPSSEQLRYHRDGWVFQMISWVATRSASAVRIVATPHMQPTRQGFDCLYVELAPDGKPLLTICEDKATESPRATVRDHVFPSFEDCETGARDAELQAELTALLRQRAAQEDVSQVIASVQWDETRRYAATVTAPPATARSPVALFEGYETSVTGPLERRSGHIFVVEDVRAWMDGFCADVVAAIRRLASQSGTYEP